MCKMEFSEQVSVLADLHMEITGLHTKNLGN